MQVCPKLYLRFSNFEKIAIFAAYFKTHIIIWIVALYRIYTFRDRLVA
ncbi:hypothetical protein HMPREF0765_4699 [Sphingobacterium spiritivorum ATCC 33300]|uniref:Uncharacterized protein n=1 Tax=Sphingobacterium spiritivorum ATCC 33300 TaxID=525372 RepID=C2G543_SPHSI|nr:hypothetical protein HMPREF0765_4699 [Sphingobacterium spiritivorum ATCC 33300]